MNMKFQYFELDKPYVENQQRIEESAFLNRLWPRIVGKSA